jgi:hypothetical protein
MGHADTAFLGDLLNSGFNEVYLEEVIAIFVYFSLFFAVNQRVLVPH